MPNHLTTVEGIFDGKAILPRGRIKHVNSAVS